MKFKQEVIRDDCTNINFSTDDEVILKSFHPKNRNKDNYLTKFTGYKNKFMGRTENIKRAKRLKQAKRKREEDALIAAGLGPTGIEV